MKILISSWSDAGADPYQLSGSDIMMGNSMETGRLQGHSTHAIFITEWQYYIFSVIVIYILLINETFLCNIHPPPTLYLLHPLRRLNSNTMLERYDVIDYILGIFQNFRISVLKYSHKTNAFDNCYQYSFIQTVK